MRGEARLALRTDDSSGLERAIQAGLDAPTRRAMPRRGQACARISVCCACSAASSIERKRRCFETYRLRAAHYGTSNQCSVHSRGWRLRQGQPERAVWFAKLARASRSYSTSSEQPWLGTFTLAQSLSAAGRGAKLSCLQGWP